MMPAVQQDVWTIEPRREGMRARARDLWRYRRLLRFFATKSLEKLYKRTVLGWAWLFIRPLFPLLVKTLIFGGVLAVGSGGIPYFLFLVVGTSVWELFASVAQWGTRSLELNRSFLSRIYVPRLILPIAMGTPAFLNFAIHLAVIAVAAAYYRVTHGTLYLNLAGAGWAVQGLVLAWVMGLGLSLWTSVPALLARDVRFTLNYVLGFWVFLTPVMYPMSSVPPDKRWLMALNPLTAAVESFKFGVLGSQAGAIDPVSLGSAWVVAVVTFVGGLSFFGRAERDAADKV
jgi:lipopolysaccharide transport system permease protein